MRRTFMRMTFLLLAGAIVNVAVEWLRFRLFIGPPQFVLQDGTIALQLFSSPTMLFPNVWVASAFYAAILWVLLFTPGKVRRTFRLKRGLCPACAYPVGTSAVCTECGKPVQPRRGGGL